MKRSTLSLTSLAALMLILLTGCDPVTRENYAKIETGMTMEDVTRILGEPTEFDSIGVGPLEASTATWQGKQGTISIQFTGEKVLIKRFLANEAAEDDGHDRK